MESRNETKYHNMCDRLRSLRLQVKDISKPKGEREELLREMRALEKELGFVGDPYNRFGKT